MGLRRNVWCVCSYIIYSNDLNSYLLVSYPYGTITGFCIPDNDDSVLQPWTCIEWYIYDSIVRQYVLHSQTHIIQGICYSNISINDSYPTIIVESMY